ncbi:MAG: endonuclease domain-containing protein [Acutalibacteraceae bacterium]
MGQNRLPRNKELKVFSSELRKNATPEENKIWYEFLRTYPVRFNRQRIVGSYILDFYCPKAKLAVEIDGSQHFDDKGIDYDARRTDYLESVGLFVLRFSNLEINECFYEVCSVIDRTVKNRMK